MTNHWADIGNASCVLIWGANPSENHPACMAHVNRARAKGAKLVVVDPRKNRTALQADQYIRIRPGTDIALANGILREIFAQMEGTSTNATLAAGVIAKFYAYLNETSNQTVYDDVAAATTTVAGGSKYTDARFLVNSAGTDYVRYTATAASGNAVSNFTQKAATVTADANTVYNRLKAHVEPYTLAETASVVGCTQQEILDLVKYFVDNSRCSSVAAAVGNQDPYGNTAYATSGYRALTMLYAMGITQHTVGSQNVKSFAVLQTLMGNMGRSGGGINALRGIHNVQGSTDMGLLFGNIPAYSGNPGATTTFGQYMDALWGNPLSGSGTRAVRDGSYDDAYNTAATALGAMALQQRGFFNMTLKWFGGYAEALAATGAARRAIVDGIYALWPKGNGDDHITMFRQMDQTAGGYTKCLVSWGQNPAVTEPNQSKIRKGLYELDTLVVVDMFETETAACSRKGTGVTYLIPASSHVEHAGSATNSGRTLQWRYQAAAPSGDSKDDVELFLRLAQKLEAVGAFSHISAQWAALGLTGAPYSSGVYAALYAPYGWTPGVGAFASVNGSAEVVDLKIAATPPAMPTYTTKTVYGSEWVCEQVYREMCSPSAVGGTIWIYTGAYNDTATWTTDNKGPGTPNWTVKNRAKARDNTNYGNLFMYHGWGYAWLVNRRVLYNNAEIVSGTYSDVTDYFMGPDSASRLFVSTGAGSGLPASGVVNYARWYRTIHKLVDKPDTVAGHTAPTTPDGGHWVANPLGGTISYAGRFPAHCEPYESPNTAALAKWGRNTKGGAQWELVKSDSLVAGKNMPAADYPLILTTIRCVEHFQGGPITRNNGLNVEVEPEPWIEINSADALKLGIADGDWINVVTARGNSTAGQFANTVYTASGSGTDNFGKGFKARVGVGLSKDQRVAAGVVAIPWHWGDRGLSTGSRANDLCIDAGDANSVIPESKACLCYIEKA